MVDRVTGRAIILRGDARALPMPDASVDLVVTSPPYFALRSYTDGGEHYAGQIGSEATPADYIAALIECTREWMRVLKPSGSLWVNLGDKYNSAASGQNGSGATTLDPDRGPKMYRANRGTTVNTIRAKSLILLPERYRIACVDELGLITRAVVVWSKPNGLPESVTDRVRRSHEDWAHLTKRPRYFSAVDEIRETYAPSSMVPNKVGRSAMGGRAQMPDRLGEAGYTPGWSPSPLGKLPGSVWEIPTEPLTVPAELGVDHFAAFPSEWPRRIILGWSPSGICVECGEGRRPVATDTEERGRVPGGQSRADKRMYANLSIDYACACTEPFAPTQPAVILDPFGGTGTTALVASVLGRIGISVDMSADYCRLARWRTTDPKQLIKADRPIKWRPSKMVDDQLPTNYAQSANVSIKTGDDTRMATTEQTRAEFERIERDRRAAVEAADSRLTGGPTTLQDVAHALHAGIIAMAESWRQQAIAMEDSTKRGAVGQRAELRKAAAYAASFAGGLELPSFLATLTAPTESQPVIEQPQADPIATDAEQIKAYLRGDTNEVPSTEPETPTITQGSLFQEPDSSAAVFIPEGTFAVASERPGTGMQIPTFVDPEPIAPPRVSWDDFAQMVADLPAPEQGSFSMITSLADCGMAYAFDRLSRRDKVRAQVPAWWNVGGTAFHRTTETIERAVMTGRMPITPDEGLWIGHLNAVMDETIKGSNVDPALWRAADKGKEGYDWWRVEGANMVARYLAYHTPEFRAQNQIMVTPDGRPGLELALSLDLAGLNFAVVIDQVWVDTRTGGLRIRDLKSGKTKQPSTFQLGGYAHALAAMLGLDVAHGETMMIGGAFYDARSGSHDMECDDLLTKHPLTELKYRAHAARQQTVMKAYLPRVSIFGGGCSSCGHRAICPTQD